MYNSILVPIDITAPQVCEQILTRALFHLNHSDCSLTLLAVTAKGSNESVLDDIRSKLMEFTETHIPAFQDHVQLMVKEGLPAEQTLQQAESIKADCIIMGGHRGSQSMLGRATLGSTAAKVATQAKCDICIVKP